MKKKVLLLLLLSIFALVAQGCPFPEVYPIEDVQNILIAGIDIQGNDIVMTVLVDTIEQGGQAGQEKMGTKLFVTSGKTVFEAKRKLHEFTGKRASFYHLAYILVGEQAAMLGIDRCLSFFCEDDETSFLHKLMITKGTTACNFLKKTCTQSTTVTDDLSNMIDETQRTGKSRQVMLLDYAITRERAWENISIPAIELYDDPMQEEDTGGSGQGQSGLAIPVTYLDGIQLEDDSGQSQGQEGSLFRLCGYALFYEDQLVEYLIDDYAQGINFIINKISSMQLNVLDNKGQYVALEIVSSHAKITPAINDTPSATIEVFVATDMVEYTEHYDLFHDDYLTFLQDQASAVIQQKIQQSLLLMQEQQTDVIGMGDAFYHKYPTKWQEIKDGWQQHFSTLPIKVEVRTKVQCTYNIINAPGK